MRVLAEGTVAALRCSNVGALVHGSQCVPERAAVGRGGVTPLLHLARHPLDRGTEEESPGHHSMGFGVQLRGEQ